SCPLCGHKRAQTEEIAERRGHVRGVEGDLRVGESHDPPVRAHQCEVSRAVVLERESRSVRGVTVDLDDEARVPPHEVALLALDVLANLGQRNPESATQAQEARLELAPRHRYLRPVQSQGTEGRSSATSVCLLPR